MFPDIRKVVFRCYCYHKPRSKCVVFFNERNFSRQVFKNQYVQQFIKNLNTKFIAFGELFVKQCNAVATQRLRRSFQIIATYKRLYGENSLKKMIAELGSSLLKHCEKKKLFFICSATFFKWENARISDEELNGLVDDMVEIQHIEEDEKHPVDLKGYLQCWEQVIDKDHFKVWRKPIPNSYLYEYKVYGTFYDVTPKCFLDIQIDLDYRKQWDNRVIKLDIIDKDDETNTEVVQWITHFPYPMYSREYVYSRRYQIDKNRNVMVLSSHAIEHPKCPVDSAHVRVHVYTSSMVIKPHKQFDDNGFDYVMTYSDDPQATYPSFCYSWLAKTGVPRFVDELHEAAKTLAAKRQLEEAAKTLAERRQGEEAEKTITENRLQNSTIIKQDNVSSDAGKKENSATESSTSSGTKRPSMSQDSMKNESKNKQSFTTESSSRHYY